MPFLTRSLILYSGSDSLPAVDYTDDTDWTQFEVGSTANLGEASAGQWLIRDEGGVIPDSMTPKKLLFAHNVVVVMVGSNTLFRGRVAEQQQFRGRQQAGRATERTITLEDQNSHLRGIVVHNWVRGAETDVARAQGLVASYLSGSPRVTTNLNGSNLVISSNLISLPAKTYSGVTPYEIMAELASNGDKETFVSVDNELALFGHDYTGYASQLRISDAGYPGGADANSTTYVPWNPRGTYAERTRLSALRIYYGSEVTQKSTALRREGWYPDTDFWEDVFWDSESITGAQAAARGGKILDYRQLDDVSYSCSIGPMSGDEIYKIKSGQQIQFKSRAARAGRNVNGTYIGDSFMTTRIREIRWRTPAEDQYIADLQLERPKRTGAYGRGSQALATAAPLSGGNAPVLSGFHDSFTRSAARTAADPTTIWGTSDSGHAWSISQFGVSDFGAESKRGGSSIDGNYGRMARDTDDGGSQSIATAAAVKEVDQPYWRYTCRFMLQTDISTTNGDLDELQVGFSVADTAASVTIRWEYPAGVRELSLFDGGTSTLTSPSFVWNENGWFRMKWERDLSAGYSRVKIWADTSTEPANWQLTRAPSDYRASGFAQNALASFSLTHSAGVGQNQVAQLIIDQIDLVSDVTVPLTYGDT